LALRIEWHPKAIDDLLKLGVSDQRRIRSLLQELEGLADPLQKLVPYTGSLKGYWKLRAGNCRIVCQLQSEGGRSVLVIFIAHRSKAYDKRSVSMIQSRR
jgi:mRNA interferase RelE/StbE